MRTLLPSAALVYSQQTSPNSVKSKFEIVDEDLSLSDTLGKCICLLERKVIVDFSLTRTTLSEVFSNLSKF